MRNNVPCGVARCGWRRSVPWSRTPAGLCDRINVPDPRRPPSRSPADPWFYQGAGREQKRRGGVWPYDPLAWISRAICQPVAEGIGLEYWGSLATYLRTNEAIGDEYLACHFREIQQGSGNDELGNVYSLPGASRLAGGPANVKSDIVPLLRMLQLGSFCPVATSLAAGKWARAIYFVFVSVIYLLALPACACLSHANSSNFAAGQQRGFPFSSYRLPPFSLPIRSTSCGAYPIRNRGI